MDRSRHERIKDIAFAAAKRSLEERGALLVRECGDDLELRREVESLLSFADGPEDPLGETVLRANRPLFDALRAQAGSSASAANGALHAAHAPDADGASPARVGDYRIFKLLGQGGMGRVYLAEQESPRRRVAVKILRHALATQRMRQRFAFEAAALGKLEHVGIARIYEAGTADVLGDGDPPRVMAADQPFIAMEFIEGRPLTEFAETAHLGLTEKLALMAQVCDAAHFAHQNAIIHRDLKPANILVTPSGQPKIIDFGIARAVDDDLEITAQTAAGRFIGTLSYMSPEQVAGNPAAVDASSDVYALGVILYQLLAGRLPFDFDEISFHEAIRIVREDEPRRLSALDRRLRGDVETIVHKALHKDRNGRYESAAALAADVRRFLRHEPIAARPPTLGYQIGRFARRHRLLVGGSTLLALVVVGAAIASTLLYLRAEQNYEQAGKNFARAERSAKLAQAVNDFLNKDLLSAVSPENTPKPDITMREVLDAAAARIPGRFPDEPLVEAEVRLMLGTTYMKLGQFQTARPHIQFAAETRARLLDPAADEVHEALTLLGELQYRLGDYEAAEATLRKLLTINQQAHGEDHPHTVDAAGNLGFVLVGRGQAEEALPMLERALAFTVARKGARVEEVISLRNNLSQLYAALGRMDDAIAASRQAYTDATVALGPQHPLTMTSGNTLAAILNDTGHHDEALALLREIISEQTRVLGADHPQTLISRNNLGFALRRLRRTDEAAPIFEEVLETRTRTLGEKHPSVLVSMSNLGNVRRAQKRYADAEDLQRRALELHREVLGPDHPDTLLCVDDLGQTLMADDRPAEAEPLFAEALERRRVLSRPLGEIASAARAYGLCLIRLARFEQAEELLLATYSITEAQGAQSPAAAKLAQALVDLYTAWGREASRELWKQRLPVRP